MYCGSCGNEIPDNNKYCPLCGEPVGSTVTPSVPVVDNSPTGFQGTGESQKIIKSATTRALVCGILGLCFSIAGACFGSVTNVFAMVILAIIGIVLSGVAKSASNTVYFYNGDKLWGAAKGGRIMANFGLWIGILTIIAAVIIFIIIRLMILAL